MLSTIVLTENTTGTSVKFKVTPSTDPGYSYTKIWYSLKGVASWSQSAQEDGNDEIEITGLTNKKMYVFIAFAYDVGDVWDEPSLPRWVIPTDEATPWSEIVTALTTVLEALGIAKVYYGRNMPQKYKSPAALIETSSRRELIGTNEGTLEVYPVSVTFYKRGKTIATGQPLKAKMEYFVEQFKYWMQRTRDFSITDLQLVTALIVAVDPWDSDSQGVEAGIKGVVNVNFHVWRSYRRS